VSGAGLPGFQIIDDGSSGLIALIGLNLERFGNDVADDRGDADI